MFDVSKPGRIGDPRRSDKPRQIGTIVDQIMARSALASNYFGWQVVTRWAEIVGEHYARKSEAIRFEKGTVYVAVPDASWRQMMAMDTPKILEIIHRTPHGNVVKNLRLVWGKKEL